MNTEFIQLVLADILEFHKDLEVAFVLWASEKSRLCVWKQTYSASFNAGVPVD